MQMLSKHFDQIEKLICTQKEESGYKRLCPAQKREEYGKQEDILGKKLTNFKKYILRMRVEVSKIE